MVDRADDCGAFGGPGERNERVAEVFFDFRRWLAAEFVVRSLNGLMDEFLIFNAALPAGEVQDMFAAGNPSPTP